MSDRAACPARSLPQLRVPRTPNSKSTSNSRHTPSLPRNTRCSKPNSTQSPSPSESAASPTSQSSKRPSNPVVPCGSTRSSRCRGPPPSTHRSAAQPLAVVVVPGLRLVERYRVRVQLAANVMQLVIISGRLVHLHHVVIVVDRNMCSCCSCGNPGGSHTINRAGCGPGRVESEWNIGARCINVLIEMMVVTSMLSSGRSHEVG
jgi:hypothetical protein